MTGHLPVWMDNSDTQLPHHYCWIIVTFLAIVCGAIIGVERGKRQKPAGLRTMILISLGASIFTQASILVVSDRADPGRIAAQVVTGIGFLGAGAIIHGRGTVSGFTTAAAIWVVAAIGVVLGSGYVSAGVLITLLVLGMLATERTIEFLLCGQCSWTTARIEYDPARGRAKWLIQEVLDDHQVSDDFVTFAGRREQQGIVSIRFCTRHRQHRSFLSRLAWIPYVCRIDEVSSIAGHTEPMQTPIWFRSKPGAKHGNEGIAQFKEAGGTLGMGVQPTPNATGAPLQGRRPLLLDPGRHAGYADHAPRAQTGWSMVIACVVGMMAAMIVQMVATFCAAPILGLIETIVPSMALRMISPTSVCVMHLFGCEPGATLALALGAVFGIRMFVFVELYDTRIQRRLAAMRCDGWGA